MIAGLDPTRIKHIRHFRPAKADRGLRRRLPKIHHLGVSHAAIKKLGASPSAERVEAPTQESRERGVGKNCGFYIPVKRLQGGRIGPQLRRATTGGASAVEPIYAPTEKRLIAGIDKPPLARAREADANMARRAAEGLNPEILQSELRGRDPTRVRHKGATLPRPAPKEKRTFSAQSFFARSRSPLGLVGKTWRGFSRNPAAFDEHGLGIFRQAKGVAV